MQKDFSCYEIWFFGRVTVSSVRRMSLSWQRIADKDVDMASDLVSEKLAPPLAGSSRSYVLFFIYILESLRFSIGGHPAMPTVGEEVCNNAFS